MSDKRFIVHLDNWAQIADQNHLRTAMPFREALAEVDRVLSDGNRNDTARLFPAGTRGWLTKGREVVSFRRTPRGALVPSINRNVER